MTIYGWDMSHYDSPDIGNAVSQGISFLTHKINGDADDPEAGQWWANVRNLPESVVLGGYSVFRPDRPGSIESKADAFLARLDTMCAGWRNRDAFILQLDAEIWNGDSGTKPSISQCNAFCDRLVARTGAKYVPIGYLPKWVYGDVSSFRYPVWASAYVSGSGGFKALYPGDSSSKWSGYGKLVSILQYTSSATIGGQTTCDANAFRGTINQLKTLVTPGWSNDMPLTTDDLDAIEARVLHAVKSWTEEDPDSTTDPKGQGRVGGWIRMANQRERNRFEEVKGILAAGVPAQVDVVALASALDALLPDVSVTKETVEQAFRDAFGSLPPATS